MVQESPESFNKSSSTFLDWKPNICHLKQQHFQASKTPTEILLEEVKSSEEVKYMMSKLSLKAQILN